MFGDSQRPHHLTDPKRRRLCACRIYRSLVLNTALERRMHQSCVGEYENYADWTYHNPYNGVSEEAFHTVHKPPRVTSRDSCREKGWVKVTLRKQSIYNECRQLNIEDRSRYTNQNHVGMTRPLDKHDNDTDEVGLAWRTYRERVTF